MNTQIESNVELSIIVLAYKAENYAVEFINQLLSEAESLSVYYEIIVVANYHEDESDSTAAIVKEAFGDNMNIKIISLKKEGNMGWDMKVGLDAASGKYLVVIDGDGQMPSSDIKIVYNIIKSGDFDLVKTYRARRYDGLYRRTISKIYNLLFNVLFRPDFYFRDINSKPKAIARETYLKMNLLSNDWFTDAEIMIEAIRLQLKICEVATVFYKNERRASFVGMDTIWEFLYNLLSYKFVVRKKVDQSNKTPCQ